jgi:sugar phosphate isomerase/epimerase
MQLGIGSWSFPWAIGVPGYPRSKHPLDAQGLLKKAKDLAVGVVQICDNCPLHELNTGELDDVRATAQDLGVSIEVGTRSVRPDHLLTYLDVAKALHAESLRTIIDDPDAPYADWLRQVIPLYADAGVSIALENYERMTARSMADLIEAVDSPYLGITLDTVNSFGRMEGLEKVVEILAPYVLTLHYKDYDIVRGDHRMGFQVVGRPAGEGRIDGPWLLDALAQAGRDPNVIVELWPPFLGTIEETVSNEAEWVHRSIRFLRDLCR